jgi:hypothetical protein
MFIQPCFISCTNNEKHMYDICVKLRELGYEGIQNDSMRYVDNAVSYAISNCKRNRLYKPIIKTCLYSFEIHYKTTKRLKGIDCNTNEKLFLAIAALRDNSDYMQWFKYNNKWYLCEKDNWIEMLPLVSMGREFTDDEARYYWITFLGLFHKATVDELIEKFK